MNDKALAEVKRELKRFQERLGDLDACTKPVADTERKQSWQPVRSPHYGGCPESSALRRSSMDLTRALAKWRRS